MKTLIYLAVAVIGVIAVSMAVQAVKEFIRDFKYHFMKEKYNSDEVDRQSIVNIKELMKKEEAEATSISKDENIKTCDKSDCLWIHNGNECTLRGKYEIEECYEQYLESNEVEEIPITSGY